MEKYIKDESPIGRVCDSITPIYKYHHRDTGQAVVVKSLLLQQIREENLKVEDALANTKEYGIPWRTIREMALATTMDHDNIARLLEIDYEDGDSLVHLVYEYAGMDLQKFMQEHPDANNQRITKNLLLQLLRGISYLHSTGVAHGGNEQSEHQLKQKLADMLPSLEEAGIDLLSKLLCLDPSKRIDASSAMKHAYFRDIA